MLHNCVIIYSTLFGTKRSQLNCLYKKVAAAQEKSYN